MDRVGDSRSKQPNPVLDRARATGELLSQHLDQVRCAVIMGPSHSGKTQTAMAALAKLDPTGESTVHTSAAILNTNAPVAPSDRSAQWQSWPQMFDRFGEHAPKCVVIDEAGSSPAPVQPWGIDQMRSRALLKKWMDAGTTFIVIGHHRSETLDGWSQWLSGGQPVATVDAASGTAHIQAKKLERLDVPDRPPNPVAAKNEIGAQGRERMHRPLGNVLFIRHQSDDDL